MEEDDNQVHLKGGSVIEIIKADRKLVDDNLMYDDQVRPIGR